VYAYGVMNQHSSIDTSTSSSSGADAIARRAYELWENEGRPEGSDLRHWLQAEAELGTTRSNQGDRSDSIDSPSFNESTAPRSSASQTRPPTAPRATPQTTGGRDSKPGSGAPFAREKNGTGTAGQVANKRKPMGASAG
jgi:hypothetical protein